MDNQKELEKIEKATSGWFKKDARIKISQAISKLRSNIEKANQLSNEEKQLELKRLLTSASEDRQRAVRMGANSYGDSRWASAAACESWLFELVNNGESSGIDRAVKRLELRKK